MTFGLLQEVYRRDVSKVTPDKVLQEVAPYGGKVLRTSLTKDKEAELQAILTNRGISSAGG